jgi:hypothetical protein
MVDTKEEVIRRKIFEECHLIWTDVSSLHSSTLVTCFGFYTIAIYTTIIQCSFANQVDQRPAILPSVLFGVLHSPTLRLEHQIQHLMPQTLTVTLRQPESTFFIRAASNSKPPSVLRYTLILLKARPTPTSIDTVTSCMSKTSLSSYSSSADFDREVIGQHSLKDGTETAPPPYKA